MSNAMTLQLFGAIDLGDPFFESLKADYPGFEGWFSRKSASGDQAYVTRDDAGNIDGFLYLKEEDGIVDDVTPPLPAANRIKVGTFKIDARGTKLGERFLKKVFDIAIARNADEIYVTVFEKHSGITKLFRRYGFVTISKKHAPNGNAEEVMVRDLTKHNGDLISDFPFVRAVGHRKYLLSIYPQWHTQLFPDSILKTEAFDVVQDLSQTNSIHKVYLCRMDVDVLQTGDVLVIYRTKDPKESGSAEYLSVATSVVVVEDMKRASAFVTEKAFLEYCTPFTIFSEAELRGFYKNKLAWRVIKFTYNAALAKRIIRKRLIEEVGIDRNAYPGFLALTDEQFDAIVNLGGVSASLIIN